MNAIYGKAHAAGLMLARTGDRDGGVAYARAALDASPPEKHSLTLRMLMDEISS